MVAEVQVTSVGCFVGGVERGTGGQGCSKTWRVDERNEKRAKANGLGCKQSLEGRRDNETTKSVKQCQCRLVVKHGLFNQETPVASDWGRWRPLGVLAVSHSRGFGLLIGLDAGTKKPWLWCSC